MKNTFPIVLAGLLVIGAANSSFACNGAKKAGHASKEQTLQSADAVPAANIQAPVAEKVTPDVTKESVAGTKEKGCCPSMNKSAAGSAVAPATPESKLTAEHLGAKAGCGMEKGNCSSKEAKSSVAPAPVEQTGKKVS